MVLCLWLVAQTALADVRVVVRAFPGPSGADIRGGVVRVLSKRPGVDLLPNGEVDRAARKLGLSADTPTGRRDVGEFLFVGLWLEGRVRKTKGEFELALVAKDNAGQEVARFSARRKKAAELRSAVATTLGEVLGPAIAAAQKAPKTEEETPEPEPVVPPPVAAPVPAVPPPVIAPEAPPPPKPKPARSSRPAVEVALTGNLLNRSLTFQETLSSDVANYRLSAAPLLDGQAYMYPFAFTRGDWLSCIGLSLRGRVAFGIESAGAGSKRHTTSYDGFGGGFRWRSPIRRHELNGTLSYDAERFRILDSANDPALVPSTDYRTGRVTVGARIAWSDRVQSGVEVGYLQLLQAGELVSRDWFPRARGFGIEGNAFVDLKLVGPLSFRIRVSFERMSFKFARRESARRVASSASDDYLTAGLGLSAAY